MEHLIINLKEKLILRRINELKKVKDLDKEVYKDVIYISSGKIFELDFLIECLDELIRYSEKTRKINQ